MTDKDCNKICGICGDKALGYNFNAITCESCKAFFRRNALRNKEFKCPFDGNCKIDLVTRRFCQRCRLKKCFDMGMKKEWILSDEEKQMKRSKISENRKRRQNGNEFSKGADSTTIAEPNPNPNLVQVMQTNHSNDSLSLSPNIALNINTKSMNGTDCELGSVGTEKNGLGPNCDIRERGLKTFEVQYNDNYNSFCNSLIQNSYFDDSQEYSATEVNANTRTNISTIDSEPNTKTSFIDISNNIYKNNNSIKFDQNFKTKTDNISIMDEMNDIPEIVYRKAIELEFASIPIRKPIDLNGNNFLEYNDLESNKLSELLNALLVLRDPLCRITSEVTGILDALKMTDQAVRRLIKMTKRIQAFKSLCQHDQIALLKGGCTELIILRSVVSYDYEREYYTIVMDSNNAALVKLDILKQAKGNVYEAHKKFMLAFRQEWNGDLTIIDLLIAIILFSPERPNIIHKDIIKLEQQVYMYLLQRYLEIKYSSKCEAKSKFLRLMTKLEELHILNEDHIRMYLDADPNHFGPLLIEIFNLKP